VWDHGDRAPWLQDRAIAARLEPAPAVQPKPWLPVNSRGRTQQSDRDSDSGTLDD